MSDDPRNEMKNVTSISTSKWLGLLMMLSFFGGFGYWAATAELSGAVVATGWVTKEGQTQSITHERGGVISKISVVEGQKVEKGDTLVLIEDADRISEKKQLETQLAYLIVRERRLVAEEAGEAFEETEASDLAKGAGDEEYLLSFVRDQVREYDMRKRLREREKSVLIRQKDTLNQELQSLEPELDAMQSWLSILKEQVEMRETLHEKGAISKIAMQETKKDFAEVTSDYHKIKSRSETIPLRLAEIDSRLQLISDEFSEKLAKELASLRSEKLTLQKRLEGVENAVARIELIAPTSGIINKLHVNTIGSAVAAFRPIVEIVPERNPIIVEVEVQPADIEQISLGQQAKLMLSAYDPAQVPPVKAQVKFVSPDRRVHPQSQIPYYVARLELLEEQEVELPEIVPGMPIEAYMETNKRTFLQILFDPITKSLRRSFRS